MREFDNLVADADERGDLIAPIFPGACWITLKGNFTSTELRRIADEIDSRFAEVIRGGNPN